MQWMNPLFLITFNHFLRKNLKGFGSVFQKTILQIGQEEKNTQ